ncbi:hypothetical protein LCI18_009382 [Fusarium solani-melongenae]|uniref:Uncharacterized protein n=1 Tax=Fusarium solani subsp. cucurbitae TaxID=2747967 RepID=A0ACD3ZB60_FUSSC|nr:hypothetical protein LCI18_009382 [Fusarium solani-melongenae]
MVAWAPFIIGVACVVAPSAVIWSFYDKLAAVTGFHSKANIETYITVHVAEIQPQISGPLRDICALQSRMYTSNPTHEPETLFERLDLDPTVAPFVPESDWLRLGSKLNDQASDAITLQWAIQKKRLMSHDVDEEDKLLDAVAGMLLDRDLASVYMSMVLPKVQEVHGQARLDAFKALCTTSWTGRAEEEEKVGL